MLGVRTLTLKQEGDSPVCSLLILGTKGQGRLLDPGQQEGGGQSGVLPNARSGSAVSLHGEAMLFLMTLLLFSIPKPVCFSFHLPSHWGSEMFPLAPGAVLQATSHILRPPQPVWAGRRSHALCPPSALNRLCTQDSWQMLSIAPFLPVYSAV